MKKLLLSVFALASYVSVNAQCSEVFMSKYLQFGGNTKAMELYNPTANAINLNGYILERWKASSTGLVSTTMSDSLHLKGSVASHAAFVIVNGQTTDITLSTGSISPKCDPALQAYANQLDNVYGTYGSSVGAPMYFKGNDCLVLRKPDGTIADIFGEIGVTVKYWSSLPTYRGGTGEGKWITKGYLMVRKAAVSQGTTAFPAEFNPLLEYDTIAHVYPAMSRQDTLDTYSLFGQFTSNCASTGINNSEKYSFVSVFPNPSSSGNISVQSTEVIASVKIYNITGQLVYAEDKMNKTEFNINTAKLHKGSYVFSITLKNGVVEKKNILIQ